MAKKSNKLEVAERKLLVEKSKKDVNPFNPSELGELPDVILEKIQEEIAPEYERRSIEKTPSPNKKNKKNKKGGKNKKYTMGKSLNKDVRKALSTGVGVAEEMGSLGMKVGKTAVKDVEGIGMEGMKEGLKLGKRGTKVGMKVGKTAVKDVEGLGMEGMEGMKEGMKVGKKSMKFGKKMLTMKKKKKSKKKGKSSKGKSSKGSYRAYLSKRLKQVKKAHPSWPQSKVFIEAVKGWKTSK